MNQSTFYRALVGFCLVSSFGVRFTVTQALAYDDVRGQLRAETKQAHTHVLNYSDARKILLGELHLQQGPQGYFIHDVYCQKDFTAADFGGRGPGPGRAPDDKILNVEHTWPQSKFAGPEKSMMKSDLHHLFPTDSQLNQIRGNFPFGDVPDERPWLKCNLTQIDQGPDGLRFDPPVVHKGNVARALFYFAVRYNLSIDADQEADLRRWNVQDPPDAFEKNRNAAIERVQGNRNPFIDRPELADQIRDF